MNPSTRDDALRAMSDDIDPIKHAGEGWFATEEYARPKDIKDKYVKADTENYGDYYPRPPKRKK